MTLSRTEPDSIWFQDQPLVLRLHDAVLIQFAFFDDGRKAQQVNSLMSFLCRF
jgi:hypothetical protein